MNEAVGQGLHGKLLNPSFPGEVEIPGQDWHNPPHPHQQPYWIEKKGIVI